MTSVIHSSSPSSPEVSILVLTFNQHATIARTLESVIGQQTDFLFEVIVADDGSTDATPEIVRRYAGLYPDRIRPILRNENIGVVNNYFDALAHSSGRFIADCAGDDRWHSLHALQRLYDAVNQSSEVTIAYGNWNLYSEDTAAVVPADPKHLNRSLHRPLMSGRPLLEAMLAHVRPQPLHLSASIYRADIIRSSLRGPYGDMICNPEFGCEDLPVVCALLNEGMVAYVDEVILDYTVGRDTISNPADLERKARYAARSAFNTTMLARHYGVAAGIIRSYIRSQTDVIAGAARRLKSRDLAALARDVATLTGIPLSLKARIGCILV